MRQTTIIGALLVLGAVAATGCIEPENSCDLKTQGIQAEFAAIEDGDSASGQAELFTNEHVAIVLGDCGDAITVNGVTLNAVDESASPVVYSASVDQADEYVFVFSRPDEGDYTSTVSGLRPAVDVITPAEGEEVSRAADYEVTWGDNNGGAGNGEIEAVISGDCITFDYEATWTDDGSDTIAADSLDVDGETTSCAAEIALTRKVSGTLDSALASSGWIEGWSVGRATFTTAPPAI